MASAPPCTSFGGFWTTGKRPSPVAVGAMPLDAFHYPTSPCSYNLVTPSGGFTLQVSLCFESTSIQSHALLDSGASTCFIDISFIRAHRIPTIRTTQPISFEAIDGRVLSSGGSYRSHYPVGTSNRAPPGGINILPHCTPRHPIVLGLSWLETHNPIVDWHNRSITFSHTPGWFTTPHNITFVGASLSLTFFWLQLTRPHC